MNETRQPDQQPAAPSPDTLTLARQKSFQDRIFGYSTLASLGITFGLLLWIAHSDLFGGAANLADLKPQLIKIVKPPIPQKPKPKKKEPPPPPPKQKPPPKVKPLKQIKPPPPRPRPTPQPRRPQPPTPVKQVAVAHTSNVNAKPTFEAPPPAPNTEIGKPVESGPAPVAPPTPPPPVVTPPAPPPPVVVTPPAPPPPVKKYVPPPPPPPPPPRPKIPDRNEPEIRGSFSDFDLPQFDANTLNTTSVTVTWDVDERGHPSNIKFRPTGNSDVDDAIRSAIQKFRFKPAVHNGVAETAIMSHTFTLTD